MKMLALVFVLIIIFTTSGFAAECTNVNLDEYVRQMILLNGEDLDILWQKAYLDPQEPWEDPDWLLAYEISSSFAADVAKELREMNLEQASAKVYLEKGQIYLRIVREQFLVEIVCYSLGEELLLVPDIQIDLTHLETQEVWRPKDEQLTRQSVVVCDDDNGISVIH